MSLVKFAGSSNSGFATQSRYCGGFLNSHDTATIDTKVRGVYSAMNLKSISNDNQDHFHTKNILKSIF